eukprot:6200073-Pleurochrysis_carterae.AAC.1
MTSSSSLALLVSTSGARIILPFSQHAKQSGEKQVYGLHQDGQVVVSALQHFAHAGVAHINLSHHSGHPALEPKKTIVAGGARGGAGGDRAFAAIQAPVPTLVMAIARIAVARAALGALDDGREEHKREQQTLHCRGLHHPASDCGCMSPET